MAKSKTEAWQRRKARIRKKLAGTAERPRLTVFRSNRHIYAQVIDDERNKVLASASTVVAEARGDATGKKKIEQAKIVGVKVADLCKGRGVGTVVFDRNGYRYHGRVLALAEGARSGGLKF